MGASWISRCIWCLAKSRGSDLDNIVFLLLFVVVTFCYCIVVVTFCYCRLTVYSHVAMLYEINAEVTQLRISNEDPVSGSRYKFCTKAFLVSFTYLHFRLSLLKPPVYNKFYVSLRTYKPYFYTFHTTNTPTHADAGHTERYWRKLYIPS